MTENKHNIEEINDKQESYVSWRRRMEFNSEDQLASAKEHIELIIYNSENFYDKKWSW